MPIEISSEKKTCTKCGKEYPLTKEYWHKSKKSADGFSWKCKGCRNKNSKKWYENNKEEIIKKTLEKRKQNKEHYLPYQREYCKKWRLRNPEKVKLYNKKIKLKRYNLTIEEYDNMIKEQNNKCLICGCKEFKKDRFGNIQPLSIDHNHKTKRVRGLLCHQCNTILGASKENIFILIKIIKYIRDDKDSCRDL